jgi:nitroreductase
MVNMTAAELQQPTESQHVPPPISPPLNRRSALRLLGLGAGTVAVAAAGGTTWLATTSGVFSTGTGPAYAAWSEVTPAGHPLSLVRAAILAANAHNTQPWLFTVTDDRIELFADMSRTIGTMDPLLREMHISLGCALENLVLAGPPNGMTATVDLMPDAADARHIATIALAPARTSRSALFEAIPDRHTNRNAYDTSRPVAPEQRESLNRLVDAPNAQLVWFTTDAQKRAFSDLTIVATQAIIADPQQAADDYRWHRSDWREIQRHKDGITIDPSGQSELIRAVSKLVPTTQQQNNNGWLSGTRDSQLPTAAAFGALVVPDPRDPVQRLLVGRIWQRIHLNAIASGLALQPLCQIPERIDRESSAGLAPAVSNAMAAMLPAGVHAIMTFRIGYPSTDALLSPRRPVTDVVHN